MAASESAPASVAPHVVVIGGASGIGAATTAFLAKRGVRATVADIDPDRGRAAARSMGCDFIRCDVTEETSVVEAAEAADAIHPVSGMVMCAAVFEELGRAESASLETLEAIFRVNYRGAFLSTRAFAQRMAGRGHGSIVNVSSFGGMASSPSYAYGPMKSALLLFTENAAVEWGRSGVRINAVSPGTTLVPKIVERLKKGGRYVADPGQFSALGRLVYPDEVAAPIAFLLSDEAGGITGTNLRVDGGMLPGIAWSLFGGVPPARDRAAPPAVST